MLRAKVGRFFLQSTLWGLCFFLTQVHDSMAAKRTSVFAFNAQTLNQGDFEFEEWIWGKIKPQGDRPSVGWLWFGPVYGLTRNVEVALPWEMVITPTETLLTDFALETRILLYDRNEDGIFGFRPMLRLLYQLNFKHPSNLGRPSVPWLGGNLIFSVGDLAGLNGSVDIGYFGDAALANQKIRYHTLGLSFNVSKEDSTLGYGGEYYHEISLAQKFDSTRLFFAGPNLSFSRGQVWSTLGILRGLTPQSSDTLVRLIFGVTI